MSHAHNKRERHDAILLRLVNTTEYEGINPENLAQDLDCNPSTIYRDLNELAEIHPIEKTERGRYRLDRNKYISNIKLSGAEAMVIYLALRRYLRQTSNAPEFIVTAMRKTATAINNTHLADQLETSTRLLEEEHPVNTHYTDIWQKLLDAWLTQRVAVITYLKQGHSAPQEHRIEPYMFEPAVLSHETYVIAYSYSRDALRTFKLDRIQSVHISLQTFTPRMNLNVNALLEHAWGIWFGQNTTRIELIFAPEIANRVLETRRHPSEKHEWLPDGSLFWSVEVAGYKELLPWIKGWGSLVEVIAPTSLREEIAKDIRKALAIYSN
jgi:predicted DNA-binding transcriptional regulator YafY